MRGLLQLCIYISNPLYLFALPWMHVFVRALSTATHMPYNIALCPRPISTCSACLFDLTSSIA